MVKVQLAQGQEPCGVERATQGPGNLKKLNAEPFSNTCNPFGVQHQQQHQKQQIPSRSQKMEMEDIASSCILDLDDASLCAVFSWLNAQELAAVAICCQRFRTASWGNPLWLQLLSRDFGLSLSSTASAGAAAAVGLYKQLLQGSRKQRALLCRAVCTDGGCDAQDSSSTYWVSG